MSHKGWKGKGEAEFVECEECKGWCYLGETDFESLADTVEGSFTCRLRENLEVRFTRIEGAWPANKRRKKSGLCS